MQRHWKSAADGDDCLKSCNYFNFTQVTRETHESFRVVDCTWHICCIEILESTPEKVNWFLVFYKQSMERAVRHESSNAYPQNNGNDSNLDRFNYDVLGWLQKSAWPLSELEATPCPFSINSWSQILWRSTPDANERPNIRRCYYFPTW